MSAPTTGGVAGSAPAPRSRVGELIFVGIVFAFSIVALLMVGAIREPIGSSNVIGARVMPYAVCILLLVTSAAALVTVLRGNVGLPEEGEDVDAEAKTSWRTVILLTLAFASLMVVIPLAGWPIAVTVLFAGASLALGAASWWKALLLGAGLGVLTQLIFGVGLGLSLPPFGTILPGVFGG